MASWARCYRPFTHRGWTGGPRTFTVAKRKSTVVGNTLGQAGQSTHSRGSLLYRSQYQYSSTTSARHRLTNG